MVYETVDSSDSHHGIGKDGIPLTEGLVGSDQQAFAFVAMSNQFEENGRFSLGLFDVSKIVNHEQVETVQLFESGG